MVIKHDHLYGYFVGFGTTALIVLAFFSGAILDRVVGIKPIDSLIEKTEQYLPESIQNQNTASKLGRLINNENQVSIPDVVEAASESVVTVSIKTQQRVYDPFSGSSIFGFNFGSPPEVKEVEQDIGTGFVVGSSGLIVTNKHVVSDSRAEYKVLDFEDKEYEVEKIYRDPVNDLAIMQVKDFTRPALPLGDSDSIRVGEEVIAIGTALGEFRQTVTTGVISGLQRGITAGDAYSGVETLEGVIQTDAAINPGNSGGPLLSAAGTVIGVNVAVSAGAQNIGFAIPINVVKASVANFNETGQFDRPFLGVRYRMISEQAALFNEVPQGAYLVEVAENSSASEAGLVPGDIITKIDGVALKDQDVAELLNKKKVGQTVTIEYWRSDQKQEVKITLRSAE